jgi:hypothetical protein
MTVLVLGGRSSNEAIEEEWGKENRELTMKKGTLEWFAQLMSIVNSEESLVGLQSNRPSVTRVALTRVRSRKKPPRMPHQTISHSNPNTIKVF